jgi:lysophospholipase L1-like esterase
MTAPDVTPHPSPVPSPYVALGDSYAAGVGGGPRTDDCWRATDGYPVLVARALGVDVTYAACIGATTGDVLGDQLAGLSAGTAYVSITIGGNDLGFVPVLVAAAEPAWLNDSDDDIDRALRLLREVVPGRLDTTYAAVRQRAPGAEVVATAYPRLFNGEDCNPATFFSAHEMTRLNAAADELAVTIEAAADRAGFGFVDVRTPFEGHAICDDTSWLHGVTLPLEASFHPARAGHAAYAAAVRPGLGPSTRPSSEPRVTRLPGRRGSAPVFSLPDLAGMRSLAGARAHGLDPDEVAALARTTQRDTAGPDPEVEAAWERLHEMDDEVALRRWPLRAR